VGHGEKVSADFRTVKDITDDDTAIIGPIVEDNFDLTLASGK
jgi:hypothetical protein